jgi:hypothetical protein
MPARWLLTYKNYRRIFKMALTDDNGVGTTMLVSPTGMSNGGFGGGFGQDGWWVLLLFLLIGGNGWGN